MIDKLIRSNIKRLTPYSSARSLYTSGVFYDANENALGSTVRLEGFSKLNRYPDPKSCELRKALAQYVGVKKENIFVGNGSDEAIDLLVRVFVNPNESVLILEPTYGMYRVAAETAGVQVRSCTLSPDFQIDFKALRKAVSRNTKIIFCCSPNNPTGTLLRTKDIEKLCGITNGLVVLDEAYIEFASRPSLAKKSKAIERLVVLRTFSKAWGLAGIRVGYCVANERVIEYIDRVKAPYNLNRISSQIAESALKKPAEMEKAVKRILKERETMRQALTEMGFVVFPSEANFLLVKYPGISKIAKKLAEGHGLIIRDFGKKKGIEDCARISIAAPAQNRKLIQALKKRI